MLSRFEHVSRTRRARRLLALAAAFAAATPAWAQSPASQSPAAQSPAAQSPAAQSPAPHESFADWKQGFVERAVEQGFDRAFVEAELAGVEPDPAVLAYDGKQPEFSRPVGDYIRSALSAERVAEARDRLANTPHLQEIQARYGVPAEILVGIWAAESNFGRLQGDFDVVRDFATLAWDGRRRAWAETQLIDALTILRDKGIARSRLRGSWAGAMGQTQFIPEAYLQLGQDGDGDGRIDLWDDPADALASAANLLAHAGWRPGESWAVEASIPPGFDYGLADSAKHTPAEWAQLGVVRADGQGWSAADAAEQASVILPAGANGPAFFAFPNHYVIRKYNNSTAYALAVGLIADAARGAPPVAKSWPYETPLSREERYSAQTALTKLGYPVGEIDGVIGTGTRTALKAWQKSQGITPDGYLTADLVRRLAAAAGPDSGAPPSPTTQP
jgi:membrane-bound lytic murein transglycosylase B